MALNRATQMVQTYPQWKTMSECRISPTVRHIFHISLPSFETTLTGLGTPPPDIHESPQQLPMSLPLDKQQPPPLGKNNSLERQETTILPPPGPGSGIIPGVGQATALLGGSGTKLSSYYGDPSPLQSLSQGAPLVRYGTRASSSVAHTVGSSFFGPDAELDVNAEAVAGGTPQRTQQTAQSEEGTRRGSRASLRSNSSYFDDRDRVPSSKSPSPMKIPVKRMGSMSPVKMDPGHARALQDSIASLLGKRGTPERDNSGGGAVEGGGEASSPRGGDGDKGERNAKRKKPQRAKVSFRILSLRCGGF